MSNQIRSGEHLCEVGLVCQLLDGVASIPQDALIAIDEGNSRLHGRGVHITPARKFTTLTSIQPPLDSICTKICEEAELCMYLGCKARADQNSTDNRDSRVVGAQAHSISTCLDLFQAVGSDGAKLIDLDSTGTEIRAGLDC
jgi:hypothetical protein